jgi:hypothetical protein
MKTNSPLARLRHHVTGAIERGEREAITEKPATQHTLGPWALHYTNDEQGRPAMLIHGGAGQCGKYVASCHGWISEHGKPDGVTPQHSANAALIASAPELLAALQIIAADGKRDGWIPSFHAELARAAIARATGETVTEGGKL